MAVKKASVKDLAEKAAAATASKKEEVKAVVEKKEEVKKEVKAAEKKAAPAKKAPAKKATAAKATELVVVEYAGGQVNTADIVAQAKKVSGKKTVKELNVYYQPENGMVYFTADGVEGSFNL